MNSKFIRIACCMAFWLITGCDIAGVGESGEKISSLSQPVLRMVPDGKKVDIGGETVSIIGTDECNTGFGTTYSCWIFSLIPGEQQMVSLSNGVQEIWTTEDAGDSRVYLVRPNGFKVIAE